MALHDDELDDNYVAALLKQDAERSSGRLHSASGPSISARRPPGHARLNTRFLRHLIRDTDSHNAALKAREEAESRARARRTAPSPPPPPDREADARHHRISKRARHGRAESPRARRSTREHDGSRRRRRDDDDAAVALASTDSSRRRHQDDPRSPAPRRRRRRRGSSRDVVSDDDHRRRRGNSPARADDPSTEPRRKRRRLPRSSDSDDDGKDDVRWRRSRREMDPLSRPPQARDCAAHDAEASSEDEEEEEEEEEEVAIGPAPPARGRGGARAAGLRPRGIDHHFSRDYDPQHDLSAADEADGDDDDSLHLPSGSRSAVVGGDDWAPALDAVRARARWKSSASAGKEARGGTAAVAAAPVIEKDVADVRWRNAGEAREWDRGKVLEQGRFEMRPGWVQGKP